MLKEIRITVDANVASYKTAISVITNHNLDMIRPLITAIVNYKGNYNYPSSPDSYYNANSARYIYDFKEEVFELFEMCCPRCEYGFHSIVSIEVCPLREKERLL